MRASWLVIYFYLATTVVLAVVMVGILSFAVGARWGASRVAAAVRKTAPHRRVAIASRPLLRARHICASSDMVDVTHEPQLVVAEEPCQN